jgi:tetratricopeptide (TPR) repeat protein
MRSLSAACSFRRSILKSLRIGLILRVVPAIAQHEAGTQSGPPPPPAPKSSDFPPADNPWDQNNLIYGKRRRQAPSEIEKDGSCFLPPLGGSAQASVRVSDLQIPAKAKRDHNDGCLALRKGKIADAESHFRKAVHLWPNYSMAWVELGQVLEAQQKTKSATDACSQPLTTEPNYLPSYLCLADISARAQNWDKVLSFSTRALEIAPGTIPAAYDYNAAANFHLHNLSAAEKSALKGAEIDKGNLDPRVHFLLAQIYEAKGDRTHEAAQLREYLKYASDPNDISMIKKYLSDVEKGTDKAQ